MKALFSTLLLLMTASSPLHAQDSGIKGESRRFPDPTGTPFTYKSLPDREMKLYVNYPPGWKADDRRPALVFFHGGGWSGGGPGVFNEQSAHYTEKGVVCVLVRYRFAKKDETLENCLRDAKSAMRWVRSHAAELGIDPNRIGAMGGSAGAQLSAATALVSTCDEASDDLGISPKPQALILYNPAIDNGPGGCGYSRVKDRYKELSPLHNIAPGAPPTLIMSGTADTMIPVKMLEKYKAAMEQAGARCELRLYEGQPHGFYRKSESEGKYYDLTLKEIDDFLQSLGWIK